MKEFFENKIILVTGGVGSIGSEIVRHLLLFNPAEIRVLDNNESGLFKLRSELEKYTNVRYLMGDVRNKERVERAIRGANIVFHAAALKHVHLCEYDPFEAIQTNVIGTQNLTEAAREAGVEKFMLISTDKAANPINTMGATKLLSEKITINANIGTYTTRFAAVRFGNVLNSSGSVIPTFVEQISKGGPVTITSPKMTRFFMSIPDAVQLVLQATTAMSGKEIFILKMPTLRVEDLAYALIEELAPRFGHDHKKIAISYIGVRPGEKMHEDLITEAESTLLEEREYMLIVHTPVLAPHYSSKQQASTQPQFALRSDSGTFLSREEIKQMLKTHKII